MFALSALRPIHLALAAVALAAIGCVTAAQADDAAASRFVRTRLWLNPFAPRLLNPQPLPPKARISGLGSLGGDKMLNPQPLPPKAILLRKM